MVATEGRVYLKGQILDVTQPANPRSLGQYPGKALAVSGAHLFTIANEVEGLQVLDVSNPAAPVLVGSFRDGTTNLVESGLLVIDISDPANPRLSGSYEARGSCFRVAATAGYAFVTETYGPSNDGGLTVMDVRDPSHPMRVRSFDDKYARAAAVSGTSYIGRPVVDYASSM
jgi:hypothetical protein